MSILYIQNTIHKGIRNAALIKQLLTPPPSLSPDALFFQMRAPMITAMIRPRAASTPAATNPMLRAASGTANTQETV